jgi:hypothetical protein
MGNRRTRQIQKSRQESGRGDEARRRKVAGYFVAVLLGAAVVAALIVVIAADGGEEASPASGAAFGLHYEGLEQRRIEAGVPTMAEGGGEHFHPHLKIYANDKEIEVPANIGIDPAQPPTAMAGLHTHDDSGTIHNEAGSGATLGDFFEIWGVPFSEQQLGPYETSGKKTVRMWVDGQPSQEIDDLVLEDGQEIVIAFGPEDATPPPGVAD